MGSTPWVLGENGPVAVVPGWACAAFAPVLEGEIRRKREQYNIAGHDLLAAYARVVEGIAAAGQAYIEGSGSVSGTISVPADENVKRSLPIRETTITEAAKRLGTSTSYTRRLVRTGELAGRKIDSRWLIDLASLDNLDQRRQAA